MSDILRSENDFAVENGDLKIVVGETAIKQRVMERLLSIAQEWFLDDEGLPYFTDIFGRNVSSRTAYTLLLETIAATPGVSSVQNFDVTLNTITRDIEVKAQIQAITGEVFFLTPAISQTPLTPPDSSDILDLLSDPIQDLTGSSLQDLT